MINNSCKGQSDFIASQQFAQSCKVAQAVVVASELSEGEVN